MDDGSASQFLSNLRIVRATMAEYEANVDQFLREGARLCSESRQAIEESKELLFKLRQF